MQIQYMNERKNLPAKLATQGLTDSSEKRGSLITRGLAAVKSGKKQDQTEEEIILNSAERIVVELGLVSEMLFWADISRDRDDKRSTYWYRKAAEQGNKDGQAYLGIAYRDGRGIEQSYEQAVFWLRKAADQGSEYAQVSLGCMYVNGQGVVRNPENAAYWFRKAAEQGDDEGQSNLGVMYELGCGVEQDIVQALYWLREAAKQGNTYAQESLKRLGVD